MNNTPNTETHTCTDCGGKGTIETPTAEKQLFTVYRDTESSWYDDIATFRTFEDALACMKKEEKDNPEEHYFMGTDNFDSEGNYLHSAYEAYDKESDKWTLNHIEEAVKGTEYKSYEEASRKVKSQ